MHNGNKHITSISFVLVFTLSPYSTKSKNRAKSFVQETILQINILDCKVFRKKNKTEVLAPQSIYFTACHACL